MNEIYLIKVFPGIKSCSVVDCVDRGLDAILVEGYGCGTLSTALVEEGLKYALEKDVQVFLMAGNKKGHGASIGYGPRAQAIKAGVVFLETACWENQEEILKVMRETPKDNLTDLLVDTYCKPDYWQRMNMFLES